MYPYFVTTPKNQGILDHRAERRRAVAGKLGRVGFRTEQAIVADDAGREAIEGRKVDDAVGCG